MSERSVMIEVWEECNNFCDFCFIDKNNKNTPDEIKLQNLKTSNDILTRTLEEEKEPFKAIGLIGGEFFQGQLRNPEVHDKFFDFCKRIFEKVNDGTIADFWIYCTLTLGDQKDLYELIDVFDKMVEDKEKHKFWVLVSYDTKGRYHTPEKLENWNYHMLNLQKYPFVRFNVTSILTEDFCQKVLSGEHDLKEFEKKYKTKFFLKQPTTTRCRLKEDMIKQMPWFFPKRKTFLQFLRFLKLNYWELFNETLNISLRADAIYGEIKNVKDLKPQYRDKETWYETDSDYNEKCGHVISYQCYCDSDACCLCDYFKIQQEI